MVRISLRYKVALELYGCLSLFTAIFLLALGSHRMFSEDLQTVALGAIGILLIALISILRNLILDVNSVKFESDASVDNPNTVEVKKITKIALELISSVSNILIIATIFVLGFLKSGEASAEIISTVLILLLMMPILILIKSLIFDYNLLFAKKKHDENFINSLCNRRTVIFFAIGIIIVLSVITSNKLIDSMSRLYDKSLSTGENTIEDVSSNIYITSITGERISSGTPIDRINIYVEAATMDFNMNSISVRYMNRNSTSELGYGVESDASHFSYESRNTGKRNPLLRIGDVGIISINLSATNQDLYPDDKGTIQLVTGSGKTVSKEIKTGKLNNDTRIVLFTT